MAKEVNQKEINDIVWKACDTFRGAIDPAEYKNYILTMLFIKYVSDWWKDKREEYQRKYKGDTGRVERALSRERFILPKGCDFDSLYKKRNAANVGEEIDKALAAIEDANKTKLENVFRNISFNSEAALGEAKERNRRLKHLLDDFNDSRLDLRPSVISDHDVIGDVYEYLIEKFAAGAGKKAGEFYTPRQVSRLLAKLVNPKPGALILDPACGSGSLLIRVANEIGNDNYALFGQENNGSTWALCRMNMFLHNKDSARIEWCNSLTAPKLVEEDRLMKFDIVVANPPFSLDKWGYDEARVDIYNRFHRGIPPKSKGDYAFISHMIESAVEGRGRIGVIVPHGVLFRGGAEGRIRQKLIEENLLDAVIGLPAQLFFGTGIPAAILVFDKGRGEKTDVLFIDASREYEDGKRQNKLRDQDIEKIVASYRRYETVEKYAYRATIEEIREAEYNLNIPRYVDTFEEEEEIDIEAVQKEIDELERQLAETRAQMRAYLKELGYGG
ncbi:MAG TPA: type I restriction-modification system subunit M [candidate division Zixibacteria bacterium]|nr:type I restriction-modification system subunit M [candidate division Zixibacteria bacterium]MDD4918013.1 type I restriction-modification system subunit M [candidate division Zixibacteria bacterium]MDM7972435.1 type I restriction-modification system subunit M [candidate division Zixibacteria bacterium]HPM38252.1 type I restriction-modification system subunit M [candidate division Zixibacteria bacterium]